LSASHRFKGGLSAILLASALVAPSAVPTVAASDFGAIIEHAMLDRFAVDPGERTLARSCADRCTFSMVGTRWGFLNRYDADFRRVWRSPPIAVRGCDRVDETSLASWGRWDSGFNYLDLGRCREDKPNLWLWQADNGLLALKVQERDPADDTRRVLQVEPVIHAYLPPQRPLADAMTAMQAQWQKQRPSHGNAYLDVASPPTPRVEPGHGPDVSALRAAHAEAGRIWRARVAGKPEDRAIAAVAAMQPVLATLDWRTLPESELGLLNDAGFWLQQTLRCDDAVDATVLLEEVVHRAPDRVPAWLNLADAQAHTRSPACEAGLRWTTVASGIAVQENARRYCTAQGIYRMPADIFIRVAGMLGVVTLDAAVCRPRGDIIRAVQASDAAALTRALRAHPEDLEQPSARGYLPLREAVEQGWLEGARQLLAAGADPNRSRPSDKEYDLVPLVAAIYRYDLAMVDLLLGHGANPNPGLVSSKPLLIAAGLWKKRDRSATANATAMVQALLDTGADIRQKNQDAETALMQAASSGNLSTVDLLLARDGGALLNATDRYGRNALHHVPPFDNDRAIVWKRLLDAGANINQQDKNGYTPLSRLFEFSGSNRDTIAAMVKQALRHHADTQLADTERGQTALHRAAAAGNLAAARALISAGAPRCPRDREGKTPADWTRQRIASMEADGSCTKNPSCSRQIKDLRAIVKRLNCPVGEGP